MWRLPRLSSGCREALIEIYYGAAMYAGDAVNVSRRRISRISALSSLTRVTLKDPSQSRDAFARVDLTGHDLRSRVKVDTPSYLKWLADDPL
jgi:hypothetical protein